jgi:hypothetical protein
MPQKIGERRQETLQATAFGFSDFLFIEIQHSVHITRIINDGFPDFSAFGKPLIGRICLENQQQGQS